MSLRQLINDLLAKSDYELHRHPAARRQQMLARHGIDLVIDVGAATGEYGKQIRRFGYAGQIVSFEPLGRSFDILQRAAGADARWAVMHCALGAEPARATINVASNYDSSSLLPMLDAHRAAAPHIGDAGSETVRIVRLDDVVGSYLSEATQPYVKLDTQGFERQVIRGASVTVKAARGLQIELSLVPIYRGGETADRMIAWAYGEGFHLVGLEPGFYSPSGQLIAADGVFFRD